LCPEVAMMPTRVLLVALTSVLGLLVRGSPAYAEIYTWTDASGVVNVSNLTPPEGVDVTRVTPDPPPRVLTPAEIAREAARAAELRALEEREKDLELQALNDRVQQLEREVELARAQPIAPVVYSAPTVQYVEPPPEQYAAPAPCDPTWAGCGLYSYWGPAFYPSTVVVVKAPGGRRASPFRGFRGSRGGARSHGHSGLLMPITGVPRPLAGRR
jgi:hypothetical protein